MKNNFYELIKRNKDYIFKSDEIVRLSHNRIWLEHDCLGTISIGYYPNDISIEVFDLNGRREWRPLYYNRFQLEIFKCILIMLG